MKKLIALLACFSLAAALSGCTSKDSVEESDTPGVEASTDSVNGELEKVEGAEASVAAGDSANSGFLDEQLPADALGEQSLAQDATPPASTEPSGLDLGSPNEPPLAAATAPDMTTPPPAETAIAPPADMPIAGVDPGGTASAPVEMPPVVDEAPKKAPASYQKAKTSPYTEGDQLLNAVYVARPKDSFKSVAKMIYGDEKKSKELKKANPGMSSLRVGDKVYYNSPQRPTDDQKMLSYYEDSGMMPEIYVAKEGDDLKKVAKNLMGFDNAWKEVYALNPVDSKSSIPSGTELRYWKPSASDSAMASAPKEIASGKSELPPPSDIAASMNNMPPPPSELPPPPPAPDMAPPMNEMPPPPAQDMAAQMPPPPQPVAEMPPPPPEPVAPPPPPPVAKKSSPKEPVHEEGMDNDMVMALGGGGILLVGFVAIMALRKRKQAKEMAAAFNETQVGT